MVQVISGINKFEKDCLFLILSEMNKRVKVTITTTCSNFLNYNYFIFFILFSFLLTINLKLIKVHVEIKIVNKEAATKRSTLLHAQCQLCMVAIKFNVLITLFSN